MAWCSRLEGEEKVDGDSCVGVDDLDDLSPC